MTFTCERCGALFEEHPSEHQKYCSQECFHASTKAPYDTHGYLYVTWKNMKSRCASDPDYAGRGIRVCERWLNSFETFAADVGERPSSGHSIDRKDNDGHYEPGNVRWATRRQQQNNQRKSHMLTHDGRTQTVAQWARELGIKYSTLIERIRRYGWTVAQALGRTTPKKGARP